MLPTTMRQSRSSFSMTATVDSVDMQAAQTCRVASLVLALARRCRSSPTSRPAEVFLHFGQRSTACAMSPSCRSVVSMRPSPPPRSTLTSRSACMVTTTSSTLSTRRAVSVGSRTRTRRWWRSSCLPPRSYMRPTSSPRRSSPPYSPRVAAKSLTGCTTSTLTTTARPRA